jgi:hypothetical protein
LVVDFLLVVLVLHHFNGGQQWPLQAPASVRSARAHDGRRSTVAASGLGAPAAARFRAAARQLG